MHGQTYLRTCVQTCIQTSVCVQICVSVMFILTVDRLYTEFMPTVNPHFVLASPESGSSYLSARAMQYCLICSAWLSVPELSTYLSKFPGSQTLCHRRTGAQGTWAHGHTGTRAHRHTGTQVQAYRHTGTQAYRHTGIRAYRYKCLSPFTSSSGNFSGMSRTYDACVRRLCSRANSRAVFGAAGIFAFA